MFQQSQKKIKYFTDDQVGAILSLQRALSSEVFPALRAAQISVSKDTVHLFFYCDGEISEDDNESAECVATEVISDYSEHSLEVDILRWDFPKSTPEQGMAIYYRRDPGSNTPYHQQFVCATTGLNQKQSLRVKVLITMMYALQGEVSPTLRGLTVYITEKNIDIFFYYDGEISEEDRASLTRVGNRVITDLPECKVKINTLRLDYPEFISQESSCNWIYHRRETYP